MARCLSPDSEARSAFGNVPRGEPTTAPAMGVEPSMPETITPKERIKGLSP
jgi:hypothetical protein